MLYHNKAKIYVEITLMNLIHDNMCVLVEGVRIVDQPHQKNSSGHKKHFGARATARVHTDLVAH